MNLWIDFSASVKNDIGILMDIALHLQISIVESFSQYYFCQFVNMEGISIFWLFLSSRFHSFHGTGLSLH
jgi:hypothetical protein